MARAEVIDLFPRQQEEDTVPYIICSKCEGEQFKVIVEEVETGAWHFKWLMCVRCQSLIPINMTPVYGPGGE